MKPYVRRAFFFILPVGSLVLFFATLTLIPLGLEDPEEKQLKIIHSLTNHVRTNNGEWPRGWEDLDLDFDGARYMSVRFDLSGRSLALSRKQFESALVIVVPGPSNPGFVGEHRKLNLAREELWLALISAGKKR